MDYVRQFTFNTFGFQQMQINIYYLRTGLVPLIENNAE